VEDKFQISVLRKTFSDIARGFSFGILENTDAYIKHLSNIDQIVLDEKRKELLKKNSNIGLPSEKEVLIRLNEEGSWTEKDENSIKELKNKIDNLLDTRKNLFIISQNKQIQEKIDTEQNKLNKLLSTKRKLIGYTQETEIESSLNSFYIQSTIFKDKNFEIPFFKENDFRELEDEDFIKINSFYEENTYYLSNEHIEHLVINNIFLHYFSLIDTDIKSLFGKPICELTFLQLNLLHIALRFRNIFRDCGNIPDEIKDNPEEIVKLYEKSKKIEKMLGKESDDNSDEDKISLKSLVGAKKEDLDSIGEKSNNEKIREAAMKNGGTLNTYQLAKLFNKNI